jgi:hypothetical protein
MRDEEKRGAAMKYFRELPGMEQLRLIGLGVAVLLEGLAVLSVVLNSRFFSLGEFYPNVISVALFVLPSAIGVLSRRLEVALLLATLPWWVTSVVYLAEFGAVWNIDLFQLGVLAGRVAGMAILLGILSLFGWLIRRIVLHQSVTNVSVD